MRNYKLIAIIFLAAFLRINYDTFIPGYNYDEIAIMSTAVQSFPFGIIKTAAENDYHAPLYQLIVHFFTHLTPEWVYIRLFNVLLSLINVYVFYKIGCLIKNKNTGYLCALVITVNHLAISTSSFVKFYALAFLLVSISLYYFIKILKYNNGYNKLGIANLFLILTSTYGFIFVFLEYFYLFFKKNNTRLYKSILISLIGFILYLPILSKQIWLNHTNIFSPHSYYVEFAPVSLYNALNDFFGPLLNYCCNLTTIVGLSVLLQFITSVKSGNIQIHYLIEFILFSIIPVTIAIIFIFKSIKENCIVKEINIISLMFFVVFILLTKLEFTGFVPIYMYPMAIILLASIGIGIDDFKHKKLAICLFIVYLFSNLFISNCYPPDKREYLTPKIYNCFEQFYSENKNAKVIATSGGRFLKKYYKNKDIFEFDNEKMRGNFQREYISLIYGKEIGEKINKKNAYDLIKPIILTRYRCPDFEKYFVENVYNKVNKGERVFLAFSAEDDTSFLEKYKNYSKWLKKMKYDYHLSKATIKEALSNDVDCVDTSILTQAMEGQSYEYLIDLLEKYFKRQGFVQYTRDNNDNWIKIFEDRTNKYSTLYLAQNATNSWIFVEYQKQ